MSSSIQYFFGIPIQAWRTLLPLARITSLCIVGALVCWFLIVVPAVNHLQTLQHTHQKERNLFRDLREQRKLQQELLQAKHQLVQVWDLLPAKQEFTSIAVTISQYAQTEHVTIPGMSYSTSTVMKGLPPKGTLTFSAVGTYPSMFKFIQHLEQSRQYLIIETINVTRTNRSKKQQNDRVRLNMKVSTFLKRDKGKENIS